LEKRRKEDEEEKHEGRRQDGFTGKRECFQFLDDESQVLTPKRRG
jgi:hypothetical protein